MNEPLGVIHYGVGPIGLEIARLVARHPRLESVVAVDINPDIAGRDLGELTNGAPSGIVVDGAAQTALANGSASVVVHATTSSLDDALPQLLDCVRAGYPVVSTCEELAFPWLANPRAARELDEAAAAAGVAVVGTGVNPGFAMDYLPVVLAGCVESVDSVEVIRRQDAAQRRLPLRTKVGAGLSREAFDERAASGSIRHVGLAESVHHVAAAFGWSLTTVLEDLDPVIAERDVAVPNGTVTAGSVAGVHQTARGYVDGRLVVSHELVIAVGTNDPLDRIRLIGPTPVEMTIAGGIPGDAATAAVVVNTVPSAVHGPAGLRVMSELPPRPAGGYRAR